MTKPIYTAIAAPGAGKTESLISQLTDQTKSGEKFIIALPTLKLSEDILSRMKNRGITTKVINSNDHPGNTTHVINGALRNGNESVVIITHEGLRLCDSNLLRGHILVIDEVPDLFELQHITNLTSAEASQIITATKEIDGKLVIKQGLKTKISNRVKTYLTSEKNKSVTSTLSNSEFRIYKTILNNGIVHSETINKSDGKTMYNFFTIEIKDIFKHIEKAKETHILAANIENGIFDLFAKHNGYQFKTSKFTPKHYEYTCDITIYPLLNEPWSKGKILRNETGITHESHLGNNTQLIDNIFTKAISNTPQESLIIIQNTWCKFKSNSTAVNETREIAFLNIDCRGLNTQIRKTAAILLFTGNPSPNDKKSFHVLAKKYGLNFNKLNRAWTVTKKLEAALQAATRTAIRDRDNTKPVHFYVQDVEVAEYFKSTYMRNAKIDNSIAFSAPAKKDNRSKLEPAKKVEMLEFIRTELAKGVERPKIVKTVTSTWMYSIVHIRRLVKQIHDQANTIKNHENLEDLTSFLG